MCRRIERTKQKLSEIVVKLSDAIGEKTLSTTDAETGDEDVITEIVLSWSTVRCNDWSRWRSVTGMKRSGSKKILNNGLSDVAAARRTSKIDAAVNTATSLTDTTKAPIYLQRTLRIREAVVLATIPEKRVFGCGTPQTRMRGRDARN